MHLKIDALAHLDPQSTPLPHGTEVVTRVAREHGERCVPQGTVGRVVGGADDAIDVAIVGVGTLRFARHELTPRRVGQAVFARRREASWSALRGCVVIETVVGSRAWGLAGEGSDTDRRGAFALPLPWRTGLLAPPEDLVSADSTEAYWSIDKTIRQALRADPNTLEMLFVESATARDPIGAWLLEAKGAFVSREIYGTFARYALAQLRRLEQGMRLAEHRHLVIEWLRDEPALDLDALAARLAARSPRAAPDEASALATARQWVKQLYRSMHDQGLIDASELDALRRFARDRAAALALPRELRPKNAYNLLRLLITAEAWLRTGEPSFVVPDAARDRLLAIKNGEVALHLVLAEAEALAPALEAARDVSPLPMRPDVRRVDALSRRIGEELARRWIERAPGPFGADAPEPPELEWREDA
ncbi:DNA polymerase beta superfamily protein [Sandaracinus amylolyticus]|nr:nucleotidyltransferase domain-containing protein [Sandaracinus amylolyticus]